MRVGCQRLMTKDMSKQRIDIDNEFLDRYRREDSQFLHNNVTGNKTWFHHYDPEFRNSHSHGVRKFKTQPSASKLVLIEFPGWEGLVYWKYLPKGTTINSDRYGKILQIVRSRIRPNRTICLLHHMLDPEALTRIKKSLITYTIVLIWGSVIFIYFKILSNFKQSLTR